MAENSYDDGTREERREISALRWIICQWVFAAQAHYRTALSLLVTYSFRHCFDFSAFLTYQGCSSKLLGLQDMFAREPQLHSFLHLPVSIIYISLKYYNYITIIIVFRIFEKYDMYNIIAGIKSAKRDLKLSSVRWISQRYGESEECKTKRSHERARAWARERVCSSE